MPDYVQKALINYVHIASYCHHHSPYQFTKPQYTSKPQLVEPLTYSPLLSQIEEQRLEGVIGTLLYYGNPL